MSLKLQATKGILWSGVSRTANILVQISTTIILARILTPEDFGVVAIALVFIALASILTDMGLGSAIIQKKDISEEYLSTIFYINIFAGCILTFIMIALSPVIANFFK